MDPEKTKDEENYMVEQQINLYQNQLPQVPRGESDNFFKEIHREETHGITHIQFGFQVGLVSPSIHDIASVIINDIHCFSEENLKIIIEGDEIWVTSTIVYHFNDIGDVRYNILESHLIQSLQKSRQILQQILGMARDGYEQSKSDEEILAQIRKKYVNFQKSFWDPNSDY